MPSWLPTRLQVSALSAEELAEFKRAVSVSTDELSYKERLLYGRWVDGVEIVAPYIPFTVYRAFPGARPSMDNSEMAYLFGMTTDILFPFPGEAVMTQGGQTLQDLLDSVSPEGKADIQEMANRMIIQGVDPSGVQVTIDDSCTDPRDYRAHMVPLHPDAALSDHRADWVDEDTTSTIEFRIPNSIAVSDPWVGWVKMSMAFPQIYFCVTIGAPDEGKSYRTDISKGRLKGATTVRPFLEEFTTKDLYY